ncbi:MAG: ParB/RepB/Spo0J family partition protein [Actinobacteria bacterium]|nr:ParB/RepB/Spo0J family partition protein [Actinomycetota bacterium]MCB8997019.1 ParB/RepB/Spo0J family partition protein [Actinomycetota bacterium]MCB9413990.1 ParB/RepB/Spo0J family partition protein [Actinomycetota bacterium]MCB9424499.1 ParB/RepB/Spo0J family partition protein [Actinomycetota bacterium]
MRDIPVADIRPNPNQPRQQFDEEALAELVHSLREVGLLQPIVVRPTAHGYEIVAGERRWRAAQEAGWATIPSVVRETADVDLLRDALLENLHRVQLNPLEEAAAYQQLLSDFGVTHEELADRLGRSRPHLSNTLRLLKLPPTVARRVAAGVLSAGHARALLSLPSEDQMEVLANRIVAEGLSVRTTEELVTSDVPKPRRRRRTPEKSEFAQTVETALAARFDTSVDVAMSGRRGRLTIHFADAEDLNRILDLMASQPSQ